MGNILSVTAATAAEGRPARDAAGGSATETTGGAADVSKTTQVTGKSGATTTGGVAATGTTAASAAASISQTGGVTQPTVQQRRETDDSDVEWEDEILDQCGLDEDSDLTTECLPDPRIKESLLTPEEKAKLRGHLERIFHPDAINGKRVSFDPTDVVDVVTGVIPYLESEPTLIEDVPVDITIVADLHGQLHDLHHVFYVYEKDGKPGWENMKFLFLGNYVDKGRHSLEIVMGLFCLKMLYPDRIFLLRGKHEFVPVNSRWGLALELHDRYEEETMWDLFFIINEAFCWLSVAAIVGNFYFCVSGGVAREPPTRRALRSIQKPIIDSRQDVFIHDLIWSDIADGMRGTMFNGQRRTSIYYGIDHLALCLYNLDCGMLVTGHTVLKSGYKEIGNLCLSLFTATGTTKAMHAGAVAVISPIGKLAVRVLLCDPKRVAWDKKLKAMDAGRESINDVDDDVTVCESDHVFGSGDGVKKDDGAKKDVKMTMKK